MKISQFCQYCYSLLLVVLFLTSCNGQNDSRNLKNTSEASHSKTQVGEIVTEIEDGMMTIFQDSKGNYWFGSKGVYKYDHKKLTRFTTEDGLASNRIRGIQEDEQGNMYFDTENGVSKFDGQKFSLLVLDTTASKQDWQMEPNDLWFTGKWNKNGAFRYDGNKFIHLEFPKHALEDEFFQINSQATFSPYDVYRIFKDRNENIWFGTSTFGACRFNGKSLDWISEREMTEVDEGPAPGVRSILEDSEGHFWFSSNVTHKYKMKQDLTEGEQGEIQFQKLNGIDTSLDPEMPIFFMSMTQGDNGDIWMASYDEGVWRYKLTQDGVAEPTGEIIHYPIKDGDKEVLIFSMYKDNYGGIWLGTHNAGALKFDGKKFVQFDPLTDQK